MAPMSQLTSKLKVQLKLSISRLRMIQQKDTALAKQQRRAMAQLLEQGKVESARIRVENIIRSDILTELHEILELYCELLLARIQLLDSASPPPSSKTNPNAGSEPIIDSALDEAIRSLIHAAPRTDVKELHQARALLMEKAGKDASHAAMEGVGVAERVKSKLSLETPKQELVDAYLGEIARTYGIAWRAPGQDSDDDDDEPSGGIAEEESREMEPALEAEQGTSAPARDEKAEELSKATPPRALGPQSPVRVAPPSPSVDNISPKVKLPFPPELKPGGKMVGKNEKKEVAKPKPAQKKDDGPGGKIPDVDELAKRFANLKR